MDGPLRLYADPVEDSEGATKRYVDRNKVAVDVDLETTGAAADAAVTGALLTSAIKSVHTLGESVNEIQVSLRGINDILDAINGEVI